MKRLELLDRMLLDARKTKNVLVKNLLLTMKGEFQNKSNTSKDSEDELLESIARSMIKSSETIGTDDSKEEIKILKKFMPNILSEDEVEDIVKALIKSNPGKNFGFYMGNLMKTKGIDGKLAKKVLTSKLIP